MSKHTFITTLSATQRAKTRRGLPKPAEQFRMFRKSTVPEEGWTNENFVGRARREFTNDTLKIRRSAMLYIQPKVRKAVESMFSRQIESIIDNALNGYRRVFGSPAKAVEADIEVAAHQALWAAAIEQEMARAGLDLQITMMPPMQSAFDTMYGQYVDVLGVTVPEPIRAAAKARIPRMARQITGITETTKTHVATIIAKEIGNGEHPFAVAETLREKYKRFGGSRAATIARTEMGRVADEATKAAMKDSGVVTHISVIGCEAIETSSPTYRGVHTCNIQNVPIEDEGELRFHINHTGAIIATGFRSEDGSVPNLPLRSGEGGAPVVPDTSPMPVASSPLLDAPPAQPPTGLSPLFDAPDFPDIADPIPEVIAPPKPPRLAGIPEGEQFDPMHDLATKVISSEDAAKLATAGVNKDDLTTYGKGSRGMQLAKRASGNEKPTFVSREQFLAEAKDAHPIGVFDRGMTVNVNPLAEMALDDAYQGRGIYGDGYYNQLISAYDGLTIDDLLDGSFTSTAQSYAGISSDSKIIVGMLRKEAKIIDYQELYALRSRFFNETVLDGQYYMSPPAFAKAQGIDWDLLDEVGRDEMSLAAKNYYQVADLVHDQYRDLGIFARSQGYDAIHVANEDYLVIVNNRHYVVLDEVANYYPSQGEFSW